MARGLGPQRGPNASRSRLACQFIDRLPRSLQNAPLPILAKSLVRRPRSCSTLAQLGYCRLDGQIAEAPCNGLRNRRYVKATTEALHAES